MGMSSRNKLHVDLIIQAQFVAGLSTNAPVLPGCLKNSNLYILGGDAQFLMQLVKEQADELLFCFNRTALKHTDLNNGVACGAIRGKIEICRVHGEKAMEAFVGR